MNCLEEKQCSHSITYKLDSTLFCSDCQEEVVSFSKEDNSFFEENIATTIGVKKHSKSIRKDLDEYKEFQDDVKALADILYSKKVGNNTYRSNVRKDVIFGCVCQAYEDLKRPRNPQEIARIMGIKRKGMSRGFKYCSSLCTGERNGSEIFLLSPMDLVPNMLEQIGILFDESHIGDIKNIYEYIRRRSSLINKASPQSIASALIYSYLRNNGDMVKDFKISKSEMAKKCGVSAVTIGKIDTEIERITSNVE